VVNFAAMKAGSVLVAAGLLLAGCGRTVTEADCTRIKDNMREAWAAESKKAAPDGAANEKAAAVMKAEGEKLANDWMVECKKELMGRRVEPKELDCLFSAKTIAEINKCSSP
jgi:hypothetical protein